jgi:zinc transport system permease protein
MIIELFSYGFIIKALIVGSLVSLCAALLGVSLVLKRYSMIGDGLSHVGFASLSIALALNSLPLAGLKIEPLYISIPVVIAAAFFLLKISENSKIKGDAAIALISSAALAAGMIIASLSRGMNLDVMNYMFGSVLIMSDFDVYLSLGMSAAVLTLYLIFYKKIFTVTFDENFAQASGVNAGLYKMLIAGLTAVTITVGMRLMGTLLISSLIIFPALSSMRLFKSFAKVVLSASVVSIVCFFTGILLSFACEIPAGASVVAVNAAVFALFTVIGSATN